jgi:hypothetical protein
MINVGVDATGFRPINEHEVAAIIARGVESSGHSSGMASSTYRRRLGARAHGENRWSGLTDTHEP